MTRYPDIKSFEKYVVSRGAEIIPSNSEWELLRFRSNEGLGIVYQNKYGKLNPTGAAIEAMRAYKQSDPSWNVQKVKRKPMSEKVKLLVARDGIACFYCGKPTTHENVTVEHLLSMVDGGNNVLANLALAHKECNEQAATLSIVQKVRLRDRMRKSEMVSYTSLPMMRFEIDASELLPKQEISLWERFINLFK